VERLRSDLVPFISDPQAVLALARVVAATWTPLPSEARQAGAIRLDLVDVICGPGLSSGAAIEISGKRLANEQSRERERTDRWNSLAFEPGDLLLMALRAGDRFSALAADPVDSPTSPSVAALRRATEIERIEPLEARRTAVGQALAAHEDLLRDYALDWLGRRGLASRTEGAGMIARALFVTDLPASSRGSLVTELTSRHFYRYELGADPVNVEVVRSLARLVTSGDSVRRPLWMQYLAASLTIEFSKDPHKDAGMRAGLIRAVTDPPPERVIDALQQQVSAGTQDPRVQKLMEAWRAASQ
jgi:hypothetical protein